MSVTFLSTHSFTKSNVSLSTTSPSTCSISTFPIAEYSVTSAIAGFSCDSSTVSVSNKSFSITSDSCSSVISSTESSICKYSFIRVSK